MTSRRILLCVAWALGVLAIAPAADAKTLTVTKTADTDDGVCNADCSVREAVTASRDGDEVRVPGSPVPYDVGAALGRIYFFSVNGNVTLTGAGPRQTVLRGLPGNSGVLGYNAGNGTIQGLTITGGTWTSGGGIRGGGLDLSSGNFLVRDVQVIANTITSGQEGLGGGIAINGLGGYKTRLERVTVAGNVVKPNGSAGIAYGGGVSVLGGETEIVNSTITSNRGEGGNAPTGFPSLATAIGGGVYARIGTVTVRNSTVASNSLTTATAARFGGNLGADGANFLLKGSIVAGGTSRPGDDNCGAVAASPSLPATIASSGGNVSDRAGECGLGALDKAPVAPALAGLGNFGGLTDTRPIPFTSPAVDAAGACGLTTDQRGAARRGACDAGAFEADPPPSAQAPAPRIDALRIKPSTFRAAAKKAQARAAAKKRKKRAPIGTTVSFTLPAVATVRLTVERRTPGRRVRGRCRKASRKNRTRKKCTRYVKLKGSISRAGVTGKNRLRFDGRLRGKKLAPGRYRLAAAATDATRRRSPVARRAFRIVR